MYYSQIIFLCTVKSGGEAVAPYFIPIMEILNVYLRPGIEDKFEPLQIMVIRK